MSHYWSLLNRNPVETTLAYTTDDHAKEVLQGTVNGGRRRGRPTKMCICNILEWTCLEPRELLGSHGSSSGATGAPREPRELLGSHGSSSGATGAPQEPRALLVNHGSSSGATGPPREPRELLRSHGRSS